MELCYNRYKNVNLTFNDHILIVIWYAFNTKITIISCLKSEKYTNLHSI